MKDVLYWRSKNGRWEIIKTETHRGMQWMIVNTDSGYNDNPIIYDDGKFGFDNPYYLPKYVKKQFKILVKKDRKGKL